MPNHHLSKRDHLHHTAKWELNRLGKQLLGGVAVDPEEHSRVKAMHEEADGTEHRFLCALCWKTFKPEAAGGHAVLFCHAVLLPGGEMVRPESAPDGTQMEMPVAVCPKCEPERIGRFVNHDWALHDHQGRRLAQNRQGSKNAKREKRSGRSARQSLV